VAETPWTELTAIDPNVSQFPARARFAGEGILIFETSYGLRGAQRTCPHLNSSLADAKIVDNGTKLRCSAHIYTYRLSDGKGVNCPGVRLKVYEVKRENGTLFARPIE